MRSIKQRDRDAAVNAFNDPNNPVQILVTSIRISATALNLQHDCSDVVFLDVPTNAQQALQAGARVVRIGQTRACKCYILTTNHSYDQVLQSGAALKMIGIIGSYTGKTVHEDEIQHFRDTHSDSDWSDEKVRDYLINATCEDDYTTMFGQRSYRGRWNNLQDPTIKDRLPVEAEFRQKFKLTEQRKKLLQPLKRGSKSTPLIAVRGQQAPQSPLPCMLSADNMYLNIPPPSYCPRTTFTFISPLLHIVRGQQLPL